MSGSMGTSAGTQARLLLADQGRKAHGVERELGRPVGDQDGIAFLHAALVVGDVRRSSGFGGGHTSGVCHPLEDRAVSSPSSPHTQTLIFSLFESEVFLHCLIVAQVHIHHLRRWEAVDDDGFHLEDAAEIFENQIPDHVVAAGGL